MNKYYVTKLSKDEFSKLGKKLTCILNIDSISMYNNIPRLRFNHFKDINSFELVSDYNCISPLSIMSKDIYEGLIIGVKDDNISVDLSDGSGIMYYSIQYGIM